MLAAMPHPPAPAAAVSLSQRALRASGVAAVWLVGALPVLLLRPRCMFARITHRPCPGCGMTRAIDLMRGGDLVASLRMHPFAVPVIVVSMLFAAVTVWLTLRDGTPFRLWESRLGRASVWAMLAVHGGSLLLWALRWLGLFGGPVPVH
jgi:hypothetical protein